MLLNGTRLAYSHDFSHLIVSQLETSLEGNPINVHISPSKIDGTSYLWTKSSSDDYIDCPKVLQNKCAFQMVIYVKKTLKIKRTLSRVLNCKKPSMMRTVILRVVKVQEQT
jgi:hypothetical protein